MKIEVEIQGISPLLMNRFSDETGQAIEDGSSTAIGSGGRGTPRDQAEKTAYKDPKTGDLFIPGPNIQSCLVDAGRFHKAGKSKLTTQKTSLVPAGIMVTDIACLLGTKEFEVDSRRIVNGATGGARLRHRARLDVWKTHFVLDVDETMFAPKLVRELVDDAGKKIGLCDFRPARKGPFGRFVVTKWVEKKERVEKVAA